MSRVYPVGAGTYSKKPDRYGLPDGVHAARLRDAEVWLLGDGIDEGYYIDLTSGMGAVILGHGATNRAISRQLAAGVAFPIPSGWEETAAEDLVDMLTWERAESVRWGKNGADATTSAVRLARAVTGRTRVVYCNYHGHHDWCMREPPMNAGVPLSTRSERIADPARLRYAIRKQKVAAVVIEAVDSGTGEVSHPDWAGLRKLCDETGTLLILDEMVTGFRMANGGAAEALGIEPDIACYGKAIANGLPLSAVVGPYEYLKRYDEDVFFSTTHAGEALSLVSAVTTMSRLCEIDVLGEIGEFGRLLVSVGDGLLREAGYPQRLFFTRDVRAEMLDRRILTGGYVNLTWAHTADQNVRWRLLKAVRELAGSASDKVSI
jgi:glutamate-1-semialdehyde aminotransferase